MSDVADVAVRFVERSGVNMEIQAELHQLQKSLIVWIHARSPDRRWPHQAPFSAGTVCSPHDLFGAHLALTVQRIGLVIERIGRNIPDPTNQLSGCPNAALYAWCCPDRPYEVGHTRDIRRITA